MSDKLEFRGMDKETNCMVFSDKIGLGPFFELVDDGRIANLAQLVCPDKHGDKVYGDSKICGIMGDGSEFECFLRYKDYQWWATEIQHTFDITMSFRLCEFAAIDLIKEPEESG